MTWLRQPVVPSRLSLILACITLGGLASTGVIVGSCAIQEVADERSARGDALRKRDVAELRQEIKANRRLIALEEPSPAALRTIIRRQIRVLAQDPELARDLGRELQEATAGTGAGRRQEGTSSPGNAGRREEPRTGRPSRPGTRPPSTPSPPSSEPSRPSEPGRPSSPTGPQPSEPPSAPRPPSVPLPDLPDNVPLPELPRELPLPSLGDLLP